MAYNKIVYDQKVLIDLTDDTVTKERLLTGVIAHDKSGAVITGTFCQGYPSIMIVEDQVENSSGAPILDSDLVIVAGQHIYDKR